MTIDQIREKEQHVGSCRPPSPNFEERKIPYVVLLHQKAIADHYMTAKATTAPQRRRDPAEVRTALSPAADVVSLASSGTPIESLGFSPGESVTSSGKFMSSTAPISVPSGPPTFVQSNEGLPFSSITHSPQSSSFHVIVLHALVWRGEGD